MLKKIGIFFTWAIIIVSSLWAFLFYEQKELYPGKKVITFATNGGVSEQNAWEKIVAEFETKYPDIKVKLLIVPLKYDEKILSLLAANIAPDVFSARLVSMQDKNVIIPIDDFIKNDTDMLDTNDLLPGMFQASIFEGKIYNILTSIGPLALFYNVSHFEKAGLKTPNEYAAEGKWNFETFLECCKKLVKYDDNGNVTQWAYRIYADYIINLYITANGTQLRIDKNGANYADPKIIDALQKWADLSLVHKVAPPISAEEQSGVVAAWKDFQRGKISMMHSGPWMIPRLNDAGMTERYDVAPPPFEEGGKSVVVGYGDCDCIWVNSKYPYESYLWLKHIASRESRITWSKLGFGLPAYKSLWEHKELWIDTSKLPKHFDVFYELAQGVLYPEFSHSPATTSKAKFTFEKFVWEKIRRGTPAKEAIESELDNLVKFNAQR
jgi:multiple sugar transport system substrate-binding protein